MEMQCPNCHYREARRYVRCRRCSAVYAPKDVEEYSRLTYLRDRVRLWESNGTVNSATADLLLGGVESELMPLAERMRLVAAPAPTPAPAPPPRPAEAPGPPPWKERPSLQVWQPAAGEEALPTTPTQPLLPWTWSDLWGALLSERTLTALIYLGAVMLVAAAVSLVVLRWNTF
ncbi:MAG: hypothetical protein ACE5IZ_02750, partial [Dehalococcoidia bacterium]